MYILLDFFVLFFFYSFRSLCQAKASNRNEWFHVFYRNKNSTVDWCWIRMSRPVGIKSQRRWYLWDCDASHICLRIQLVYTLDPQTDVLLNLRTATTSIEKTKWKKYIFFLFGSHLFSIIIFFVFLRIKNTISRIKFLVSNSIYLGILTLASLNMCLIEYTQKSRFTNRTNRNCRPASKQKKAIFWCGK